MSKVNISLIEYLLASLRPFKNEELEEQLREDIHAEKQLFEMAETIDKISHAIPPVEPSEDLLRRLLYSTEKPDEFQAYVSRLSRLYDLPTTKIESILSNIRTIPAKPWRAGTHEGMSFLHFKGGPQREDADCGLIALKSGYWFPKHSHLGAETALLIQGEVVEDDGNVVNVGDFVYKEKGSSHAFKVVGDKDAIFAVIVYQGIKFL